MSKTISKSTLSIFIILFVVIIALSGSFKILSDGIYIKQFKIADIQISGFYLKLNNKFILNIKEVNLTRFLSKKSDSSFNLRQSSDYFKYVLWGIAYFEQLHLERITLNDQYTASVIYDGKQYVLAFPKIKAIFDIQNQDNNIILDIKKLSLKEPDFDVSGRLIYSLSNRSVGFGIVLSPQQEPNFKLLLQGSSNFKAIKFQAKTSKLTHLNYLYELLSQNLPKHTMTALDERLFNSLKYEYIELKSASFNIQLNEKKFLKSFLKNTKIDLFINQPNYSLDSTLPPISAKQGKIKIANEQVILNLDSPAYEDTPIEGFLSFAIENNTPKMHINVGSNHLIYDKKVQDLLHYFHINIPLDRVQGNIDTKLDIALSFLKDAPVSVDIDGIINAQNATLNISTFQFLTKQALIDIKIHPLLGENHINIDTQHTIYQNIFDIDTKTHLSLFDKKIQTSMMIHTLRVSTNPEINQALPNLQHLFENTEPLDSTKDPSLTSSMLKAYYQALYNATHKHHVHYAKNEEIKTDTSQNEPLEDPQDDNAKNANMDSSGIAPLTKPAESSAPTEQVISFDNERESEQPVDSTQPSPESNPIRATLDSTQATQPINDNAPQEEQSPKSSPHTNPESTTLDSNLDSTTLESSQDTPPKPKEPDMFKPDFSRPMSQQEMQEAIIKVIEQEQSKKFTYDIFNATYESLPQIDLEIDFGTSPIQINIPQLQTYISIFNNEVQFNIVDLGVFEKYSPLMQYLALQSGNVLFYVQNANNIKFEVSTTNYPSFLLDKQGNTIKDFSFYGEFIDSNLRIHSSDNLISLSFIDNTITARFKDIDVDLNSLISSQIPAIQEIFSTSDREVVFTQEQIKNESKFLRQKRRYERQNGIKPQIISIETQNIRGFYKAITLPFETFNAKIQDARITADATYKNGIANIDIIHGNIFFKAGNFGSKFVNTILNQDIVRGGLFGITGIYRNEIFNGEVQMQGTSFKGFAIVQNIIGLIDTIPSLIMFRNPGVGAKGYEVSKGKLRITLNTQYIGLESIDLIGKTMDVRGNGIIELDTQEVDIGLSISTLKSLSGILNKIPIVGYLLIGKDGKITTQIGVKGTLSDPKTQINLAEDLLNTPLKVIERAFTPIDMLIDEIRKGSD